ncbi:MAG: peptidase C1 [Calditrichales bacterium]|nr:MAG: peptidase C1 [Calditrichales bacterium]
MASTLMAQSQSKNRAVFVEPQTEFYDQIRNELDKFNETPKETRKVLQMDFSGLDLPVSADEFEKVWHQPPVSQGNTGSCWCFSTTSFFESEIYRLSKRNIRLSEMYTVYWEFVEKARRFVEERGNSLFDHGSMGNAVVRIWKKYGIVPAESYSGMLPGQPFHDHDAMFDEMNGYLESVRTNNAWNEADVLANIKSILNHYMGEPPLKVVLGEAEMTPIEYLEDEIRLNLDDYVDFLSMKELPYFQKVVYPVPDNWWNNSDYYNVPLDDFMKVVKTALGKGYSFTIGGDVSEPGNNAYMEVSMIPTFDIPSAYIDEDARQFRFSNETTTDDHGIHAVGVMQKGNDSWFLIKDSGSGARDGANKGYRFFHQDYIKLKMLDLTVHKDVVIELLKKFPQEMTN